LTSILFLYFLSVVSNILFLHIVLVLSVVPASRWRLSSRNILYCLFCYVNALSSDLSNTSLHTFQDMVTPICTILTAATRITMQSPSHRVFFLASTGSPSLFQKGWSGHSEPVFFLEIWFWRGKMEKSLVLGGNLMD